MPIQHYKFYGTSTFTTAYGCSHNWLNDGDVKAVRDNSAFKQIVQDCVGILLSHKEAICFYEEQKNAIMLIAEKKGLKITCRMVDGDYILEAKK